MNITAKQNDKFSQKDLWVFEKWFPFWDWEHWQKGIFCGRSNNQKSEQSAQLLKNCEQFRMAIKKAVLEFPICSIHNLSNQDKNHRSFLGWLACFSNHGATKIETCVGWISLNQEQMHKANAVADQEAEIWRKDYVEKIFNN